MNFDVFFNALNGNMVQYLTGSYWMLAIFYIVGIFALVFLMDLGLKYALVFTLPAAAFFLFIGWFTNDLATGIFNLILVCVGFMLGLVLLKWLGDW